MVRALRAADAAPPPQVETWSLQQTGAVGSSIFLQDRAAARATDALLARFGGKPPEGLIGWIVVENGEDQLVRFLLGDPAAPRPGIAWRKRAGRGRRFNILSHLNCNFSFSAVTLLLSALP